MHTKGHAAARAAAMPSSWGYPDDLPVVQRKTDLMEAIAQHPVVIVAGETGSGKTTQIPKMCMELGRGVAGLIGHTQPRRIAARAVAERISEELGTELGATVGYQVRFTDTSAAQTAIKVMTDGVLLAELRRDRDLRRYDTLIIDEAHERSLNIDFLLGYIRQLLPRRPDLKVVITSATIDVHRFAAHFASPQGTPAPIIEVSGRSYPVQILYRPLARDGEGEGDPSGAGEGVDQVTGIREAVAELWTHPSSSDGGPQDILVFCSGEREIRDACEAIASLGLADTEVLPLYGRLSAAEQHRVFSAHAGRRVVVATNVAETSLTVPGIRYVVDAGTARISRYSQRLKVQRLPIEPISQASALQRSGRCGRLADGIAIRLYSEEDFQARPEFTDPEIRRTTLASVILAMTDLGLGHIERFPFIEAPDQRQIADGVRLLHELQAINPEAPADSPSQRLTPYGRAIAGLPVDPRLARMLIEAGRNGALAEMQVIAAALSIQDPRERPTEKRAQADQSHARFIDHDSDFVTLLNLWAYLKDQQKNLSGSAFRRMCRREYLHYLRIREWQDLHTQIARACKRASLALNSAPASHDQVHQSLVPGLLSLTGVYDRSRREYLGARGARFVIQPGSALFRKNPDWIMSAELVETTRLWARVNAGVDPAWIEAAASHLVKRSYSEPRWSRRRAGAIATERVTLYGVPLVAGRAVPLGRIDAVTARDLFIRHALVQGEWDTTHGFLADNHALVNDLEERHAASRRRESVVDDETLMRFYDARVPQHVLSGAHFDTWWKAERRRSPDHLSLTPDMLVTQDPIAARDFPGIWSAAHVELPLSYRFEPGAVRDGLSVHVPIEVLNQLEPAPFTWSVAGFREDLAVALIKTLPKTLRRSVVPAPDHGVAAVRRLTPDAPEHNDGVCAETFMQALARALSDSATVRISAEDFDTLRLPTHLRPTFIVESAPRRDGTRGGRSASTEIVGQGKDLHRLQSDLAPTIRATMADAAASMERTGMVSWDIETLPPSFVSGRGAHEVRGYPALVDTGHAVDLRVLGSQQEAESASRLGVRRLLLLGAQPSWKRILAQASTADRLALGLSPHASVPDLHQDLLGAAVDAEVSDLGMPHGAPRTREHFHRVLGQVQQHSEARIVEMIGQVAVALRIVHDLAPRIERLSLPAMRADMEAQMAGLIGPGFISSIGYRRLPRLKVYLRAMLERLDKGTLDRDRDTERMNQVHVVLAEYEQFVTGLRPTRRQDEDVVAIRWQIEELRVSVFAQRLGAAGPVSAKRIYAAMDAAEDRTT